MIHLNDVEITRSDNWAYVWVWGVVPNEHWLDSDENPLFSQGYSPVDRLYVATNHTLTYTVEYLKYLYTTCSTV
jgi:hypothetical protein